MKRVLVVGVADDLELREAWERTFVAALNKYDVVSLEGMSIIPPLKDYSNQEIVNILRSNRIDGILAVAVSDFWTNYFKMPEYQITQSKIKFNPLFNSASVYSVTQGEGGEEFNQHNLRWDVRLVRAGSDSTLTLLWRANSTTAGGLLVGVGSVLEKSTVDICEKLASDGIISRMPKNSEKDDDF